MKIVIPQELLRALLSSPAAKEAFERLAPSHQREWAKYVSEAKRPETRVRRAESAARKLAGS
jgi:uncharacterized protein YdeI (YjbR/CyaY-like superfamily)